MSSKPKTVNGVSEDDIDRMAELDVNGRRLYANMLCVRECLDKSSMVSALGDFSRASHRHDGVLLDEAMRDICKIQSGKSETKKAYNSYGELQAMIYYDQEVIVTHFSKSIRGATLHFELGVRSHRAVNAEIEDILYRYYNERLVIQNWEIAFEETVLHSLDCFVLPSSNNILPSVIDSIIDSLRETKKDSPRHRRRVIEIDLQ